jgi:hypothetical protein
MKDKVMENINEMDLRVIAKELIETWKADMLKVSYLVLINCRTELEEMLYWNIIKNKIKVTTSK